MPQWGCAVKVTLLCSRRAEIKVEMGTTARDGVEVVPSDLAIGLLLQVLDQVGQGVAVLAPLLLVDAAGEGHWLEVDAPDHVDCS